MMIKYETKTIVRSRYSCIDNTNKEIYLLSEYSGLTWVHFFSMWGCSQVKYIGGNVNTNGSIRVQPYNVSNKPNLGLGPQDSQSGVGP